ncbi:MAG: hypothetical protein PVG83_05155 [Acidimicrobiia bacterium]|jgi:hypothetical protein
MADDLKVRVDGARAEPTRTVQRSTGVMVAAAFIVGLGLGLLIVPGVQEADTPGSSDEETAAAEGLSAPVVPETEGIYDVVEDFPDALVAVGNDGGSGYEHLLWPLRGPLVSRTMDAGDDVTLDVASTFIAHTTDIPGLDGRLLSMGRFNSIRPVVTGVTSFAWHDAESGSMAFTTEADGVTKLWTVGADLAADEFPFVPEEPMRVGVWGDWGWALETDHNQTVLVNPEGEERARVRGIPIASTPDGWILVASEGYDMVSAGGGVNRLARQPDIGFFRDAAFAPNGDMVAVAGSSAVAVMDLHDEGATVTMSSPGSLWVAWSSDSRFLMASGQRGVRILDLGETRASHEVLQHLDIVAGGVIPVSRP